MAKKKSKVVSNREPKKIEEEKVVEEKVIEPVLKVESIQDEALALVQKYHSLHNHKAEVMIERLSKEEPCSFKVRKTRSFRMSPDLDSDLIAVIKQSRSSLFEPQEILKESEIEKTIAHLDLLYRVLIKLGFHEQDVLASLQATMSKSLEEHLDWLCIHVPYDRMPIGYFDKYFNEEEDSGHITLLHNETPQQGIQQTEELEELVSIQKDQTEDKLEAIKAQVLQAAEKYMQEEEPENVNEKYAALKIRVQELEETLSSFEKQEDTPEQITAKVAKDIKRSKDTMRSLEGDWEFDKRIAHDFYAKYLKDLAEIDRKKREKDVKKKREEKRQREEELRKQEKIEETIEDVSSDEGGLFDGLMMAEEELGVATTPSNIVVSWTCIDLSKALSWKGKQPKDILFDYCKKQNLNKQNFASKEVSPGMWRSALTIGNLSFELPEGTVAESRLSAENLVAAHGLFGLESNSSVYQLMHISYKDLWAEWLEDKILKVDGPRIENDKNRLAVLKDLVIKSYESCKNKSKSNEASDRNTDQKEKHNHTNTANEKQETKKTAIFNSSQKKFLQRLDTKEYLDMKANRASLPVTAYRDDILGLVKNNQVVIISGETGCGKSTQVPQFLAEDLLMTNTNKKGLVICTQPRRISALSIASRVSLEMGDAQRSVGFKDSLVGYQIRLESKFSEGNVLMYCTTGILLQRLQSDLTLKDVTHVIIDEVHERTIESDFLLIMLRQLCQLRPDLKIILMSATVEAQRFSAYFDHCPVIAVPGRTYPVQVHFLEDVVERIGYVLEEDSKFSIKKHKAKKDEGNLIVSGQNGTQKRVHYEMFQDSDEEDYVPTKTYSKLAVSGEEIESTGYSKQTLKMIKRMDDRKVNYDLILELLEYICKPHTDIPAHGAILVFLPGMNEIRSLYDLASSHPQFGTDKFLLIPLHSTLSSDHQEKAFEVPPEGVRKIVFSTNIAETGVTISDVTVVIDTGMSRTISYDDKRKVSRLLQKHIAKANAKQRRGRAGRVQEGVCFHLFTQDRFEQMSDYETPEILRLPLEELCLRIKVYKLGSIVDVLGSALDAPSRKAIENAIQSLQEVNALTKNETLTPLGTHLVNLPVDMHVGKMILFGAIFRCLDPILTIAACLSFKGPFVRPFGKELEADMARSQFQCGDSDFLTLYMAYSAWREKLISIRGKPGSTRHMQEFCKENFLSQQNLETIEEMKRQFLGLLINSGFVKTNKMDISINRYDIKRTVRLCDVPSAYDKYKESLAVINAALSAGLYPKIAEYVRETDMMANKVIDLKLHPSSMLFRRQKDLMSELYVYNTVVMSSSDYQNDKAVIWEAASISPAIVMLLATDIEIKHKQRRLAIDGWLSFDCFARTSVILKFFRAELTHWFSEKMKNPKIDLTDYNQDILNAMVKMLESFDY
ncbi:P-loop containing nucleoside triphosphate hydrolase protein [Sporodiniella umbellata]|nr:P-loop containing nucleoside triphosphate hydrolase protein [Sporodiniella umbellata]